MCHCLSVIWCNYISFATSPSVIAWPRSILFAKNSIGTFLFFIAEFKWDIKTLMKYAYMDDRSSFQAHFAQPLSLSDQQNRWRILLPRPLHSIAPITIDILIALTCQTLWNLSCSCWKSRSWNLPLLLFQPPHTIKRDLRQFFQRI